MALNRQLGLSTTGQSVQAAGAAEVHGVYATNTGAAVAYLKIYNKATAPTQSDTPKMTIVLPTGGVAAGFVGFVFSVDLGLWLRATTGAADNDTGAPGANEVIAHVLYK